jgi:alpha-L-fucosidase
MKTNGDAIYDTRPWKIYGSGPSTEVPAATDAKFNENKRRELTANDVRFTRKGQTLFAFFMGWPNNAQVTITPLARHAAAGEINRVELLGFRGQLKWARDEASLKVQLPAEPPGGYAFALKINGLKLD